jgi:hypothetical protein
MAVLIPETAGLDEAEIREAEFQLGCALPLSYRAFVTKHDGATPESNIFSTSGNQSEAREFVHVREAASLRTNIEGFPREGIPVAADSCGNYVWLDPRTGEVFFWDHELEGIGEKIADGFDAFLEGLQPFDAKSIELKPGQVISAWIDPKFKAKFD